MRCDKLSVSRAGLFAEGKGCPLKYQLRYEENIRFDDEANYLTLGKCVHYALEEFMKPNSPHDDPKELFLQEARRVGFLDQALIKEGKRIIDVFLDDLRKTGMPNVLETEMEFDFYTDLGVPVYGFIDRIDLVDPVSAKITDYKTGNYIPTQEEAEAGLQLPVYHIAVKHKYPFIENVELCYHYLRTNTKLTFKIDEDRVQDTLDYLHHIYMMILEHPGNAKGVVSMYCSWCEYSKMCPEFQEVITGHYSMFSDMDKNNIQAVVNEYESLDAKSRILAKRVDLLKGIIKEHSRREDNRLVLPDGRSLTVSSGRIAIKEPQKPSR